MGRSLSASIGEARAMEIYGAINHFVSRKKRKRHALLLIEILELYEYPKRKKSDPKLPRRKPLPEDYKVGSLRNLVGSVLLNGDLFYNELTANRYLQAFLTKLRELTKTFK